MSKYWIFQDESGEPAKDEFFIVGLLGMTPNVKRRLLATVQRVRDDHHFNNELHSSKFSNKRLEVYKNVLDEAFKCWFTYKAIVVKRTRINIAMFNHKRHLAYNKFTEMLIYNHIKGRSDQIHIRPDPKNRMKEDNFYEYIVRNLNDRAFLDDRNYEVKSCKPSDSKKCDAVQVCDLITGVVKNVYSPAGDRKNEFSGYIMSKYASKINIWEWEPKKRL